MYSCEKKVVWMFITMVSCLLLLIFLNFLKNHLDCEWNFKNSHLSYMKAHDNEIEAASGDDVKWDHMWGYQMSINHFYFLQNFIKCHKKCGKLIN